MADGQDFGQPDDGDVALTGGLGGPLTIPDGANLFDGSSLPTDGTSRASNGGLWDIHTIDITATLAPGTNTLQLDADPNSDCLGLVVAAIDLPAGAAPTEICGNGIDDDGNHHDVHG